MGVDFKIHRNFLQELLVRQGLRFHTGEVPEHEAPWVTWGILEARQNFSGPQKKIQPCGFTKPPKERDQGKVFQALKFQKHKKKKGAI